jgi:hypothetical protein
MAELLQLPTPLRVSFEKEKKKRKNVNHLLGFQKVCKRISGILLCYFLSTKEDINRREKDVMNISNWAFWNG